MIMMIKMIERNSRGARRTHHAPPSGFIGTTIFFFIMYLVNFLNMYSKNKVSPSMGFFFSRKPYRIHHISSASRQNTALSLSV